MPQLLIEPSRLGRRVRVLTDSEREAALKTGQIEPWRRGIYIDRSLSPDKKQKADDAEQAPQTYATRQLKADDAAAPPKRARRRRKTAEEEE